MDGSDYLTRWNSVLLDWVNCLELTPNPAVSLRDLRESDFLSRILNLLHAPSRLHNDLVSNLNSFVKLHYPNISISTSEDFCLTEILSLLLHYTCVNDRRESLTAPLCLKLSNAVQLNIKDFLENFDPLVTQGELSDKIKVCVENVIRTPRNMAFASVGDSPVHHHSPLETFLHTPSRSSRVFEKDREIKRLRNELQLQKYEKEDLVIELEEHKLKIKTISEEMEKKSNLVSELSQQLTEIETKATPHKAREMLEIERRLKCEVLDSQNYIFQLRREQDELQCKNELVSKQLEMTEKDACLWQSRAISAESKSELMSDACKQHEVELSALRINCNELSSILDELRRAKKEDDSLVEFCEDSSQNKQAHEILGEAVVEIQLREVKLEKDELNKLNAELNELLKLTTNKSVALEEELFKVRADFSELNVSYKAIHESSKELDVRVNELRAIEVDLEAKNEDLLKQVAELVEKNVASEYEMGLLRNSLYDAEATLTERDELITILNNDFEKLQSDSDDLQNTLNASNVQYEALQKECNEAQYRYEAMVEKYNQKDFELESRQKIYNELDTKIDENLRNLERLVYGCNELKFNDKVDMFRNLLVKIESNRQEDQVKVDNYKTQINEYETLIRTLESDVKMLNEHAHSSNEQIDKFKNDLCLSDERVQELDAIVAVQNNKIEEYGKIVQDLNNNITELTKLKVIVSEFSEKVSTLEDTEECLNKEITKLKKDNHKLVKKNGVLKQHNKEIENQLGSINADNNRLKCTISELEVIQKSLNSDLFSRDSIILELQNNKAQLITSLDNTKLKFTDQQEVNISQNREHLEKVNALNGIIQNYERRIDSLQTDLKVSEDKCALTALQLEDISRVQVQMETNYEKRSNDFNRKIDLLSLTVENLEKGLAAADAENKRYEKDLEENMRKLERMSAEKCIETEKCEDLRKEIHEIETALTAKEELASDMEMVISKNNKDILTLKLDLKTRTEEFDELKEKICILHEEKQTIEAKLQSTEEKKEQLESRTQHLTSELDLVTKLKDELSRKYEVMELDIMKLMSQLNMKNKEMSDGFATFVENRNRMEAELTCLKQLLEETTQQLTQANEDHLTSASASDKQISQLHQNISALQMEVDTFKAQEISCLQEIATLKDELSYTVNRYTEALQAEKELKLDTDSMINNLTESLHAVVNKYNNLETEHKNITMELQAAKATLHDMNGTKQLLERDLVKQKEQFDSEYNAAIEEYKTELQSLTSSQLKLEADIQKYRKELCDASNNQTLIANELLKSQSNLHELQREKAQLLDKITAAVESNRMLQEDYNKLKIENNDMLKSTLLELTKTKNTLEETTKNLNLERERNQRTIEHLNASLSNLRKDLENCEIKYKDEINEKDIVVGKLQENIKQFEDKLGILEQEKEKVCLKLKELVDNQNELLLDNKNKSNEIERLQTDISKQHCAFDILETGRNKLSEVHDQLLKQYEVTAAKHKRAIDEYESTINEKEQLISDLQFQIGQKTDELTASEQNLQKLNIELDSVSNVVDVLENEKENLKGFNTTLTRELYCISEDNTKKMAQQVAAFQHVKGKYDQLKDEMLKVTKCYEGLKVELIQASHLIQQLEKTIQIKEEEISEFHRKYESALTLINNKDKSLGCLQEELETKLERLEAVSVQKRDVEARLQNAVSDLDSVKKSRRELMEEHTRMIEETEVNLLRAHDSVIDVKNDLMYRIETLERDFKKEVDIKNEIELLLEREKKSREFFEIQLLEATNEKNCYLKTLKSLKTHIESLSNAIANKPEEIAEIDIYSLNDILAVTKDRVVEIYTKSRELNDAINALQQEKSDTVTKIEQLESSNSVLIAEKEKALKEYEQLQLEKTNLTQEKNKDTKYLENLKTQFAALQSKCDALTKNEWQQSELETKLEELKSKNAKVYKDYEDFISQSTEVKKDIEKMVSERNTLDCQIQTLKEDHITLQIKSAHLTNEKHRLHFEQKHALEIIISDISKQFNRLSKMAYNICLKSSKIFEKTVTGILSDKPVQWKPMFSDLNINEVLEKLEDLKDNTINTEAQLKAFEKSVESLNLSQNKTILKENVNKVAPHLQQQVVKKEEDYKQKFISTKNRLILVENAKNNYEKKLKQLREENKSLVQNPNNVENDVHYTTLIKQHNESTEKYKKEVQSCEKKYAALTKEFEYFKSISSKKVESSEEIGKDLDNLRKAYSKVLCENSKLERDIGTLQQSCDEKHSQLDNLRQIKEAYEKLFEDNNKLMAEIDTLKYKRNRDREEFVQLLNQEKENPNVDKRIQEVRNEYDLKLKKMREKMMEIYKSETEQQQQQLLQEKDQNITLMKAVEVYKEELHKAQTKMKVMESERQIAQHQLNAYHAIDHQQNIRSNDGFKFSLDNITEMLPPRMKQFTTHSLPRNIDVVEEIRIQRRTSISKQPSPNIEMEDEEEMFNNKYLQDLKERRCEVPFSSHRESRASRMQELAYRNSLCLPHLKSSYPAETQFLSSTGFKEDDLKAGIATDMNDSMSTALLPPEKRKKDIGTTAYKRPGPPTPSKNAGRLSLQSNDFHILRERDSIDHQQQQQHARSPRRLTPKGLKGLFSRSSRDTEVGSFSEVSMPWRLCTSSESGCHCACPVKFCALNESASRCFLCARITRSGSYCCITRLILSRIWLLTRQTVFVISICAASIFITSII